MKLIHYFPYLFFVLLISCDKVSETTATRRIINTTDYGVDIRVSGDDQEFQYQINGHDTLDIHGTCYGPPDRVCALGWTSDLGYGEIIFENERVQKFEDLPSDCNIKSINADPISGCYGYSKSTENSRIIYTYLITEEDYNTAEQLED